MTYIGNKIDKKIPQDVYLQKIFFKNQREWTADLCEILDFTTTVRQAIDKHAFGINAQFFEDKTKIPLTSPLTAGGVAPNVNMYNKYYLYNNNIEGSYTPQSANYL